MTKQKSVPKSLSVSAPKGNLWRAWKKWPSECTDQELRKLLTSRELHERLMLRNEQTKQIHLPEVYNESEDAKKNVSTWMNASLIVEAAPQIISVS